MGPLVPFARKLDSNLCLFCEFHLALAPSPGGRHLLEGEASQLVSVVHCKVSWKETLLLPDSLKMEQVSMTQSEAGASHAVLTCPGCSRLLEDAKFLTCCGHMVCCACAEELGQNAEEEVRCPVCLKPCSLGDVRSLGIANQLTKNLNNSVSGGNATGDDHDRGSGNAYGNRNDHSNGNDRSNAMGHANCSLCEMNKAAYFCYECNRNLCHTCVKSHEKLSRCASNNCKNITVALDELRDLSEEHMDDVELSIQTLEEQLTKYLCKVGEEYHIQRYNLFEKYCNNLKALGKQYQRSQDRLKNERILSVERERKKHQGDIRVLVDLKMRFAEVVAEPQVDLRKHRALHQELKYVLSKLQERYQSFDSGQSTTDDSNSDTHDEEPVEKSRHNATPIQLTKKNIDINPTLLTGPTKKDADPLEPTTPGPSDKSMVVDRGPSLVGGEGPSNNDQKHNQNESLLSKYKELADNSLVTNREKSPVGNQIPSTSTDGQQEQKRIKYDREFLVKYRFNIHKPKNLPNLDIVLQKPKFHLDRNMYVMPLNPSRGKRKSNLHSVSA